MDELSSPTALKSLASADIASDSSSADISALEQKLAQTQEAARQEAYAAGHEEGHAAGYAEAHQQGYADGLAAAQAEAQAQLQEQIAQVVEPLRSLCLTFDAALKEFEQAVAQHVVELALATGQQLARRDLELKPEHITALVHELLQERALNGQPLLSLAPDDLPLVREHLAAELDNAGWQLRADPSLTRGGCRVTSEGGELDATWETRCRQLMLQHLPAMTKTKPRTRKTTRKVATPASEASDA